MRFLRKNVLTIALYLALILDASFSLYLHQFMYWKNFGGSCLILPIAIMLINLFDDTNIKEFWLALAVGIVADIYFWGIIGIYAVFFPLISLVFQKIARFLPEIFWTRLLAVLVGVILLSMYCWLILSITGLISVSFISLILSWPLTLAWSTIFTSATYWLWGLLAQNYPFLIDLDAYKQ